MLRPRLCQRIIMYCRVTNFSKKDGVVNDRLITKLRIVRRPILRLVLMAGVALLGLVIPAQAQRLSVPNTVPEGSPIPRVFPPSLPNAAPALPAPSPAAPNATPPTVSAIQRVSIEGATAFSQDRLQALAAGLTGPAVPAERIEDSRVALVNLYRSNGYVYTAVSAFVDHGALRFIVTEGHVTDVQVEGDVGPVRAQVLRFLRHLTEIRPIDTASLERWLLLATDIPGLTVQSVLRAAPGEPGGLLLIAQVKRAAIGGLLTADNRGFRQAGPEELLATADFNSFTPFGERTELSLFHTFNNTQIFGQASSEFFVGASGLRVRLYGGAGDTQPSGLFRAIGYDGTTTVFGGQVSYPLIRARAQTLNLIANFDALESAINADTGVNNANLRQSFDSLRVLRFGATYAREDNLLGAERGAVNAGSLRVSQGLPGLGASSTGSADLPRKGESVDFTKVDAEISRTQTLFQLWEQADIALVGILAGQFSNDVLPPAEQYFLGGTRFNRGYYAGQVTGDTALVGTLELQLNTPIALPKFVPQIEASAQFYGFYDYGETWQRQSADPNHTLNSVGTGVRLFLTQYTEFDVEGVARLTRYPTGSGPDISALKGGAVYWRVLTRF